MNGIVYLTGAVPATTACSPCGARKSWAGPTSSSTTTWPIRAF